MKKLINLKDVKILNRKSQKNIFGNGDLIEFGDSAGGYCAQENEICGETIHCCSPAAACSFEHISWGFCYGSVV